MYAAVIAIENPRIYRKSNTKPCRFNIPKTLLFGITSAINIAYTGNLAEQVINGVTNIVINHSFQLEIVLVAMMAGIAHAVPEIKGIILLPFIPNFRMILSIRNTTLLM